MSGYSQACRRLLTTLAALLVLAPVVVRADAPYKLRSILTLGDTVGDLQIRADGDLEVGTLNNSGQLTFVTENAAGGETLLRYAEERLTSIVAAGGDAPGGKWPDTVGVAGPVSMNRSGLVAFAAAMGNPNGYEAVDVLGTFRWDGTTQPAASVALQGMSLPQGLMFESGPILLSRSVINNNDEIAFAAPVKNAAGEVKAGIFFLDRNGQVLPVALPDQPLSNGATIDFSLLNSLNDAGVVVFTAIWKNSVGNVWQGAYVWEKGAITQVAVPETKQVTGRTPIVGWAGVWVHNQNRDVLFWTNHGVNGPNGNWGPFGLYRSRDGTLAPLLQPGDGMPGGGKLLTVDWVGDPNEAGQYPFIARLADETQGLYILGLDGQPRRVLEAGATTNLGTITKLVGFAGQDEFGSGGLSLNSQGQIALVVQLDDGPDTLVLLTPSSL